MSPRTSTSRRAPWRSTGRRSCTSCTQRACPTWCDWRLRLGWLPPRCKPNSRYSTSRRAVYFGCSAIPHGDSCLKNVMPTIVHVVDDDEAVLDSTRVLLETYEIEVCTYISAEEFL